jgi:transposase
MAYTDPLYGEIWGSEMGHGAPKTTGSVGELSEAFWQQVEPLLPERQRKTGQNYVRKQGGGRKPKDKRLVFEGIVFALRTGCPWKELPPARYGSSTAIHRRFVEWLNAGVFERLWQTGLAEWDEMEGIPWRWQIVDGAPRKGPLAQEAGGQNPPERRKERKRASAPGRRAWRPAVKHRERGNPTDPHVARPMISENRD